LAQGRFRLDIAGGVPLRPFVVSRTRAAHSDPAPHRAAADVGATGFLAGLARAAHDIARPDAAAIDGAQHGVQCGFACRLLATRVALLDLGVRTQLLGELRRGRFCTRGCRLIRLHLLLFQQFLQPLEDAFGQRGGHLFGLGPGGRADVGLGGPAPLQRLQQLSSVSGVVRGDGMPDGFAFRVVRER
jgi:hypothetical protein